MKQLIIFIKNPELGKVKTRLAKSVGEKKALDIYLQLVNITRNVSSGVDAKTYVYYDQYIDHDDYWPSEICEKKVQKGSDLGRRMANAFEEVFTRHPLLEKKKVIIIGSDCAELSSKLIENAFDALDNYDTVIGPSFDGGYYLLGMKVLNKQIFENIIWSSESVLRDTLRTIEQDHLTCHLMPTLHDIDTIEDWQRELLRLKSSNS